MSAPYNVDGPSEATETTFSRSDMVAAIRGRAWAGGRVQRKGPETWPGVVYLMRGDEGGVGADGAAGGLTSGGGAEPSV